MAPRLLASDSDVKSLAEMVIRESGEDLELADVAKKVIALSQDPIPSALTVKNAVWRLIGENTVELDRVSLRVRYRRAD